MCRAMLCALLAAPLALADDEPAPTPVSPKLVLKVAEPTVAFGERPRFKLAFENPTTAPLPVVLPCDGSQHGLRTPSYAWTLERVDGKPVATEMLGLCGTVNPLTPSFFTSVPAKGALPIPLERGWLGPPGFPLTWLEPGRYRARMTYTWDPAQLDLAMLQAGVAEKVQACPKLELQSAPVEFEIAAPSEAQATWLAAWRTLSENPEAPAAQAREALGEPAKVEPYGHGQAWRYPLGPGVQVTVIVQDETVMGSRVEYVR